MIVVSAFHHAVNYPDPDPDLKRGRNTNAKKVIKYNTTQTKSQEDSSLSADGQPGYRKKAHKKIEDKQKNANKPQQYGQK